MLITYIGRRPMMCTKKAELRPYNMPDLAKVHNRERTEHLQWIIWAPLSLCTERHICNPISSGIPVFLSIEQPFYSHSFCHKSHCLDNNIAIAVYLPIFWSFFYFSIVFMPFSCKCKLCINSIWKCLGFSGIILSLYIFYNQFYFVLCLTQCILLHFNGIYICFLFILSFLLFHEELSIAYCLPLLWISDGLEVLQLFFFTTLKSWH